MKEKKGIFFRFEGNDSNEKSSDSFDVYGQLEELIILNIFSEKNLLKVDKRRRRTMDSR